MINMRFIEKISEYHNYDIRVEYYNGSIILFLLEYGKIIKECTIKITGVPHTSYESQVQQEYLVCFLKDTFIELYYHFVYNLGITDNEFKYVWDRVSTKLNQKISKNLIEINSEFRYDSYNFNVCGVEYIPSYFDILKFCFPQLDVNNHTYIRVIKENKNVNGREFSNFITFDIKI